MRSYRAIIVLKVIVQYNMKLLREAIATACSSLKRLIVRNSFDYIILRLRS